MVKAGDGLFQIGQSLLDAAESLTQEVLAGGIAETDAGVVAKGRAHDGGHIGLVQQVECHIGGVLDFISVEAFSIIGTDIGEEIESTLWQTDFEAGDFAKEFIDHVAALAENFAHIDDILACGGIHHHGTDCGFLSDGAGGT